MTDVGNGSQYACKIIPKNRMQKIHMQKVRFCRKRMPAASHINALHQRGFLFADRA